MVSFLTSSISMPFGAWIWRGVVGCAEGKGFWIVGERKKKYMVGQNNDSI